jgi:hypothetical protein
MGTRIHRGPALANEPKATADCGGDWEGEAHLFSTCQCWLYNAG